MKYALVLLLLACSPPPLVQVATETPAPVVITHVCHPNAFRCAPVLAGPLPWAMRECVNGEWAFYSYCSTCSCQVAPMGGFGVVCGQWILGYGDPECARCDGLLECAYTTKEILND